MLLCSLSSRVILRSTPVRSVFTSFVRNSSILGNLLPACSTCGINLQNVDKNRPGYYYIAGTSEKPIKEADKNFENLYKNLDQEDKLLLLNDPESSIIPDHTLRHSASHSHDDSNHISCVRCRDALFRLKFNPDEFPVESTESILSQVDPLGNIVHLVSAFDFPLTLNPSIFKFKETRDIKVIITKADLLFAHSKTANNYGLKFYRDYLFRKYGILPENVFLSSGKVDWNIKELLENLLDNSYFIGDVNVGKSTLIKSLLYGDQKFHLKRQKHQQLMSKKDRVKLEKEEDYLINNADLSYSKTTFKAKKLERSREQNFKAKNGPGVSYMPAFTRGVIKFDLNNFGKTIYDVPGIGLEDHGIYRWIKEPSAIKQLGKGTSVPRTGSYDSHYTTVKGGQIYTIGGLFYLRIPPELMVQVRNCINFEDVIFKNIEKSKQVIREQNGNNAIDNKILVTPETADNLVKYVFPPFYGNIDLVIKGIGHINIKPVGKYVTEGDPFVVYLPKGAEAVIRKPIMKYISKTIVGRDKKGNPLSKKHWVSKGVKEVHPYTGEVFYSRLVPVKEDVENLNQYVRTYCENMNGREVSDEIDEESILKEYWIEA